jgi:hypothetical protein
MIRKSLTSTLAAAVLLLAAGCSGSQDDAPTVDETTSSPSTSDELVDVTSGRPLSEFEGMPSYEWRKTIAENKDDLLERMQEVAPHLEEKDFSDVLSTCDALGRGLGDDQVVKDAVTRFSGGPDEQVSKGQADELVELSEEVCPS